MIHMVRVFHGHKKKEEKMRHIPFNDGEIMLPSTVAAVKVTNLLTPYIVRVYETRHYDEKLNSINKKLLSQKEIFSNADSDTEPKIGDPVLVCNRLDTDVDLPGWLCRGCVSSIKSTEDRYNIILIDYGISIVSRRKEFVLCSANPDLSECLSFTVGLYNVLPLTMKNDSSMEKEILTISKEWSLSAIAYTRELMSTAETIYFDPLVNDKHGRCYGEFYLNIQDTLIRLSEALVVNRYAIYLGTELLKFIKNPKSSEQVYKEVINNETIFYFNISRELNSTMLKERCVEKAKYSKEIPVYNELENNQEKVLVYGEYKYECLNSTLDARFPLEIHKAWKSLTQSCKPKKIQSYIWPAIQKGLDVIAIGTKKSGKSIGHGFAVCGLLAAHSNLPQGINPSALILCSSSSKALEVNSLCMEFVESYKTIRCVAAINGKPERSLVANMFNGCQILISTPSFLARFMDQNRKLLNFKKLRYLILDDGDVILDKYYDSISQLFKKHDVICNRELRKKMLQIIITASQWTPRIKKIASVLMDNPYICISSFVEAAIFKSVHPKVYIINSKQKDKKILDLLGDEYSNIRTMIVCRNNEEAIQLHNFLATCKDTLLAHENMDFTHLQGVKQYWNACMSGSYPVLISTDDILSDIGITNVTWLIHYSIFLQFKTRFSFRFSTLLDALQMEKCNCKVTILVEENTDVQFLHIIKIMQRMNALLPEGILESVKLIASTLENKKENYPICDDVKCRGFCDKETSCAFRHKIISEIDAPLTNIQINDKIKLRVVSIHNVTHVSARIISYIKFDTLEEIEFSNTEQMQITMKIQEFYSCTENRKRCEMIDVGCICALEEPVDTFKRVQILNITIDEGTESSKYVDVRCIDNGVILYNVNVYRLLYMPEEFRKYPVQVMEIFLTGVIPYDNEGIWNNCAIEAVHQWFKENVDDKSYVIGTVNLHLGNTIWVDTLEVGTKLIGYKDVIGSSLRTELLNEDHAVENSEHLKQMYQLCRDAGFSEINGYDLNV